MLEELGDVVQGWLTTRTVRGSRYVRKASATSPIQKRRIFSSEGTVTNPRASSTLRGVEEIIKLAREAPAPGLSGAPYKVFKQRPRLQEHLGMVLKVIWRKEKVPHQCTHVQNERSSRLLTCIIHLDQSHTG